MRAALLACTHSHLQGALMVNDEELLQGFSRCRELGALPMVGVLVLFVSGSWGLPTATPRWSCCSGSCGPPFFFKQCES